MCGPQGHDGEVEVDVTVIHPSIQRTGKSKSQGKRLGKRYSGFAGRRDVMGEWKSLGSPCIGGTEMERTFTFFSQGTFILPLPGMPGRYIYMGDQWEAENLGASRWVSRSGRNKPPLQEHALQGVIVVIEWYCYVWLPMWVVETAPPATPIPLALNDDTVQPSLLRYTESIYCR
jgi:hypothetical protein